LILRCKITTFSFLPDNYYITFSFDGKEGVHIFLPFPPLSRGMTCLLGADIDKPGVK
jgi:hypothetical protein